MADNDFMKELIAFARDRGYVWGPSPEIYGGLSGFYTYGPLGKLLKNNVEDAIRRVFNRNDFWEVQCPIIMPAKVWEASGHLGGFTDPLIKDEAGGVHRVDKLIEEQLAAQGKNPDLVAGVTKSEDFLALIKEHEIIAPNGKKLIPEITHQHLMMQTTIGLDHEAYNRPETATTTYLPFMRYFDYFRKKVPFGVFQIGYAFRNEISPRQFILRLREFTQAEGQLFIFGDQKDGYEPYEKIKNEKLLFWSWELQNKKEQPKEMTVAEARKAGYLKNDAYAFTIAVAYNLYVGVGIPKERIRMRQHAPDEKAFYADDAWDIEVNLNSFGWTEMCGIHDRTDYDLTQHAKYSGKKLEVSDETHKKEKPHVLEIAFGTDRMTFCLLDILFNPQDVAKGKTTFKIPARIAPIKAAIYPLVKKEGMPEIAQELYGDLTQEFVCTYDESGSIGRRYLRAAEMGIPFCITIDGQTAEDGTVTIRERDTEEQKRIASDDVASILHKLITGKKKFSEL